MAESVWVVIKHYYKNDSEIPQERTVPNRHCVDKVFNTYEAAKEYVGRKRPWKFANGEPQAIYEIQRHKVVLDKWLK